MILSACYTERVIGRLKGRVVERQLDGSILFDVAGVGYEVFIPLGSLGRLGDGELTLHVHTHAREDALVLYGFETTEDKYAFRSLLSVSSIGPKLALSVLSSLNADALARAIQSEDRASLKGISGVGKKTVERIFLDLKDKLVVTGGPARPAGKAPSKAPSGPLGVVTGALVSMGYKQPAAERACEGLDPEGKTVSELLKEALAALA